MCPHFASRFIEPSRRLTAVKRNPKGERSNLVNAFLTRAKNFLKSEDGPTATEYAVMLALIIVVALAAIGTLGGTVNEMFTTVETGIRGQLGP